MSGSYSSAIGSFVIGYSPIGGTINYQNTSILSNLIPSYLYQQYADDDNLQALVMAFNQLAQNYVTWFNQIGLPVYTSSFISGPLLDWIGQGLYGIARPVFTSGSTVTKGAIDTFVIGPGVPIGGYVKIESGSSSSATDDVYKRVMTWNLYKGDGFQFTTRWLKRRVYRFLNGINGTDPGVQQTYSVSVAEARGAYTISVATSAIGMILQQAFANGVLNFPFQYSVTVDLT